MVEIEDPNHHYPLGCGTPDERTVPFSKLHKLGTAHDDVFPQLQAMMEQTFDKRLLHQPPEVQQAAMGQRALTQSIMLLWCYTAHDIERLRIENDDLRREIEKLRKDVGYLLEHPWEKP